MGAIDKFLNAMKMNTEPSDYDYYDDETEFDNDSDVKVRDNYEEKPKKASKVTAFTAGKKKSTNYGMEIRSIKPTSIEEASLITDELLDGNSVIINVANIDVAVARRILDFAAGSVYALKGTLKPITDSIFVAVPVGVNIDGAFSDKEEE